MKISRKKIGSIELISSNESFYDDCPVCRLMKKAEEEGREPTEKELMEAFEKTNTQN